MLVRRQSGFGIGHLGPAGQVLNLQRVQGSSPCAPTNLFRVLGGFLKECFKGFALLLLFYCPDVLNLPGNSLLRVLSVLAIVGYWT